MEGLFPYNMDMLIQNALLIVVVYHLLFLSKFIAFLSLIAFFINYKIL